MQQATWPGSHGTSSLRREPRTANLDLGANVDLQARARRGLEGRLRGVREALERDIAVMPPGGRCWWRGCRAAQRCGVIALQHENTQVFEYADRAASLFAKVGAPDGRERAKAFANQLRGPSK